MSSYVEPTRTILKNTLNVITQMYSSREGYDFFNFINESALQLANYRKSNDTEPTNIRLYDPNLPFEYLMKDDLLCDGILRICFSEARGSVESLISLVEKLAENDGTTKLTTHIASLDKGKLFDQLATTNQVMANKSDEVPTNGHDFFLSNIGYDTITFDNGQLCYNGQKIYHSLDFVHDYLLLPPSVASAILFNVDVQIS